MPIYWKIGSRHRLVVATAEGDVTRRDADAYLDAVEGGGALAYRKLHDARVGTVVMDHDGNVAELAGRMLGILAAADRPIKLFTDLVPTQRWIDSLVPAQ